MRIPRSSSALLALVLIGALAVRIAAAVVWDERHGGKFFFGDSDSYWVLAGHIYRGEPYQYGGGDASVFRTPGYPLVLASLFCAYGNDHPPVLAARLLGAVLGTITIGGVALLGRLLFSACVGNVAAALVAVYPGAIAESVFVLSDGPFATAMVFELTATWAAWRSADRMSAVRWAALAGILAGAATLLRPSWIVFAPAVVMARLLANRHLGEVAIAVGTIAGFLLLMAPWWLRNLELTGHFVPTTLQVGASLYDALNPEATGASNLSVVPTNRLELLPKFTRRGDGAVSLIPLPELEYELDRALRQRAIGWAVEHPREVLVLAGKKLLRLWNVWPNEPAFRSWPLRLMTLVTYVPLMALAIYGSWRRWPRLRSDPARLAIILCWLPAVYLTALHVVFVSSLRYREPAMLTLAVLAAAGLATFFGRKVPAASVEGGA